MYCRGGSSAFALSMFANVVARQICCIPIIFEFISMIFPPMQRRHLPEDIKIHLLFNHKCFISVPSRSVLSEGYQAHASKTYHPPPPPPPPPPPSVCIKAELDQTVLYDDLINEDRRKCGHAILQNSWCCHGKRCLFCSPAGLTR